MHICFVAIDFHDLSRGGGIASYVYTLAEQLIQNGHEVTVIAKSKKKAWEEVDGIRVLHWPFSDVSWYVHRVRLFGQWPVLPIREFEWSLSIKRVLLEVHRRLPIDIIEGCESGSLFLSTLAVPYIMRLHGEAYVFNKYSGKRLHLGLRLTRQLELSAVRRAVAVTSPSQFQAQEMAGDLGWSEGRIHVIPNPLAPRLIQPVNDATLAARTTETVLYTGRIAIEKGTLTLLRSISYAASHVPGVKYVIVGGRHSSIDDAMLNAVLDEGARRKNVMLVGHVDWQDIASYYREAAIFALPSFYETFGISCIEAMAFALPVVASKVGGLPEVVEEGVTGILVPPGDANALGEAIVYLLRNPEIRRRMGLAGRERVLSNFTVSQVAAQTLSVYQNAVGQGCASS